MRAKDDAMVEQVASAIAIEDTGVSWHDVSPRDRTYYVRLARAALAAQPAPSAPVGVLAQRIEAYHWDIADKPVAAQFAAELRSLAQQPAAVDGAMHKVAAIAHSGGLIGMSPHDALTTIRRLSLPYWGKEEKPEQVHATLAAQPAPSVPVGVDGLVRDLVCEIERNTCMHEETHRGGVLWEICDLCGAKWADDRGGRPEFQWPDCVERAHEWLTQQQENSNDH